MLKKIVEKDDGDNDGSKMYMNLKSERFNVQLAPRCSHSNRKYFPILWHFKDIQRCKYNVRVRHGGDDEDDTTTKHCVKWSMTLAKTKGERSEIKRTKSNNGVGTIEGERGSFVKRLSKEIIFSD